ncbi:helix-turn-helix domain-containing protein [Cytobacillus sp. FSL R5-0596]|uniref:helix-turn-helix domain-containing protein n=1 Tax=Cytobacillus sp. FSL R5-0596 TaxID=2954696 RepID=UPI0030F94C51
MLEKNLKNLGQSIHDVRVKLNLSQKELAKGICSQSQISKIESGEISPYIHTLIKISKKLGIHPSFFVNQVYKDQYEFINDSRTMIRKAVHLKDYREVKRLVNHFSKHPSFQGIEEKQFLIWHKGIATYYLDKDFEKSIAILTEAYNMKNSIQYTEQDIQILNSLAIIFSEEEQWYLAKEKFITAINVFNESFVPLDISIYIRLCYNVSKLLLDLKEYKESLFYAEKGLELCKHNNSNYLFGELLYQKGSLLVKLDNINDGLKFLQNSCTIFEVLNKESYLTTVKKEIKELENK